jgi:AraC-like DNA-binding protein
MAGIPHRGDSLRHRHFLACHFPALRQLLPRHEVMVMHTHFWFVCAARSATQVSVPADRASSLLSRADLPAGKRAVANYIEDHVADHIALGTLAQIARLSRFHFSRAFKRAFGMPPHRYHMHRRIERAKSLLAESSATVTVGFWETSSFSTTFRRATGVTPSSFQIASRSGESRGIKSSAT